MRILVIGPQSVFPPVDGGKEGIFGAISILTRYADISYAYPAGVSGIDEGLSGYINAGIRPVPVPCATHEDLGLIIKSTLGLRPYKFQKYCTPEIVNAFASELLGLEYDLIVCHHPHTVALAERLCRLFKVKLPIILREHNIEYELVRSYRKNLGTLMRFLAWPFEVLTRKEEQSIWRRVYAVAMLTDFDLNLARSTDVNAQFFLAREGVPLPVKRSNKYPGRNAPLLVLLNPRATQSVANLRDFINEIWIPARATSRELQGIELHVTGVDQLTLGALVNIEASKLYENSIRALGFLPSLAETFSSSLALVSPTYIGGGIRKKILEAMANQIPVIATELDISTCEYFREGINLLPMNTVKQFISSVAQLRNDSLFWQEISSNVRITVEENANWDLYAKALMGALSSVAPVVVTNAEI